MNDLTHIDGKGRVRMVDVTPKTSTDRSATASGTIQMLPETLARILENRTTKGNVLETARIAGIMAAKETSRLIPMCHPLNITYAQVDFKPDEKTSVITITATVRLKGSTGVEMEALTAVCVAGLTIYDMCKAVDKEMVLSDVRLLEKKGGKSGHFKATSPKETI